MLSLFMCFGTDTRKRLFSLRGRAHGQDDFSPVSGEVGGDDDTDTVARPRDNSERALLVDPKTYNQS